MGFATVGASIYMVAMHRFSAMWVRTLLTVEPMCLGVRWVLLWLLICLTIRRAEREVIGVIAVGVVGTSHTNTRGQITRHDKARGEHMRM